MMEFLAATFEKTGRYDILQDMWAYILSYLIKFDLVENPFPNTG